MLGQTFDVSDIPRLFALILIELLLSADNALILGAVVQSLPKNLRSKALLIGASSSLVLRAIAIAAVSLILRYPWLELLGAAYLLYLSLHHFYSVFRQRSQNWSPQLKARSFWKTIITIELLDISFALDSIIAGISFIATPGIAVHGNVLHPKIWIVYTGGVVGAITIRYAASLFSKLIDRFPRLSHSAYLLVGLVGIKLSLNILAPNFPHLTPIFWFTFAIIFLYGFTAVKQVEK